MADHPEGKFLGEPPLDESTVTDPGRAVFLSYASQDAQAAQKICEALRAGGIEVSSIGANCGAGCVGSEDPHQIHDCALFMPVVFQHTRARLEGYFGLEWKLAVDRSHLMATERLFLVPGVVDGTRDQDAFVPDAFRAVQWTRLPGFQRCGRGCGFSLDACGVETCCGATWRT